jgi:O-antigen/teichoic acid export membrane protein
VKALFNKIKSRLLGGQERTQILKKNIVVSLPLKFASVLISLVLVPLTINYVDSESYGVWLTLSSITGWFAFFNIGLTNGLRNRFTEAVTQNNTLLARKYVSTTYTVLTLIFAVVWIVVIVANNFVNWAQLLNIDAQLSSSVSKVFVIVFTYFCLQFIFRIIITILTADHKPAMASSIDVLGQLISLGVIFILTRTTEGSLVYLSLGLCAAPLAVLALSNVVLFSAKYRPYRPSLRLFDIKCCKSILNLGMLFFVIQIAGVIQYQMANFFIGRYIGMEDVTAYNIAYKYFNVLYMVFSIMLMPFWSAVTNAYALGDTQWIVRSVRKYLKMLVLFLLAGTVMLLLSPQVYRIWIGENVIHVPFSYSLWCLLYFAVMMFGAVFVNVLNGIGALKIQYYSCFISPVLFLTICLGLIHYNVGVISIFIASIASNFNGFLLAPIQYRKIFIEGKRGIWRA